MMRDWRKSRQVLTAGALALALAACFPGCKEHSAASSPDTLPPAPVLHAEAVASSPLEGDPLANPLWRKANWGRLVSPVNDTRTTPPTEVACAYDANNLYVAFVCASDNIDMSAAGNRPWEHDSVELWLDTASPAHPTAKGFDAPSRAAGCEVFRILATPKGEVFTYWYRSAEPPKPKEDGSPDYTHPLSMNLAHIAGLQVRSGMTKLNGQAAWTTVLALPLGSLPAQLRAQTEPGTHWHANLIRNEWVATQDGKQDLLQSNFSPVYESAQAVSPYRMADMVLDSDAPGTVLTLQAGH
jgi:hypothetical protein